MNEKKCRVCLKKGKFESIFRKQGIKSIAGKIMSIIDIPIYPDDGLPSSICNKCLSNLKISIKFVKLCKQSDLKLRARNKKTCVNPRGTNKDVSKDKINTNSPNNLENASEIKDIENIPMNVKVEIDTQDIKVLGLELKPDSKPQCFVCGRIVSSKLKYHMKSHTGEKCFTCEICSKQFVLKQSLKLHMRIHTVGIFGEKPFICSTCGAKFSHPTSLVVHKRLHTGQSPYKCKLCPRAFYSISALQYHTNKHTGEKKECETCKKMFTSQSDLNKHVKIHTGIRPHVCNTCNAGFKRMAHLKEHKKRKHNHIESNKSVKVENKE